MPRLLAFHLPSIACSVQEPTVQAQQREHIIPIQFEVFDGSMS